MSASRLNACTAHGVHLLRSFERITFDGTKLAAVLLPAESRLSEATADEPSPNELATRAMEKAYAETKHVSGTAASNNRGEYTQITTGISHGIGRPHPMNIRSPTATVARAAANLIANPAIKMIAASASSEGVAFWAGRFLIARLDFLQTFAPATYQRYSCTLSSLCHNDSTLRRNFDESVFAATTFNLGPRVCTLPHRDRHNLPNGFCAITALGRFDPMRGGHLILWDLNLVVEFPAGTTVLIASAVLAHSNLPVADNETRMSITHYSAGALFRYVDDGFRLRAERAVQTSPEEHLRLGEADGARALQGWNDLPDVTCART